MTTPAGPARLWRLMLVLVLGLPAGAFAQGQEGPGEIEITITVLPAPSVGTTAATVTDASLLPASACALSCSAALSLLVVDTRGSALGWQVQLAERPREGGDEGPLWLTRYPRRAEALAGQPLVANVGPHGRRLSVGQPLTRQTPVFVAAPGTGAGIYQVQLAVGTTPGADVSARRLVVSLPSAP